MNRLAVRKTYKLFLNGQFPRTESGRSYPITGADGSTVAEASRASRKDLRAAVVAARKALPGWASSAPFLRSQILYRAAEIMESRAPALAAELELAGTKPADARHETTAAIDLLVHYAGWCDKYQALFSSVNPVTGPYFNFSVPEPVGVVGILAPDDPGLLGLVSALAPVLAGGNTAIALAAQNQAPAAIALGEIFATCDLPAGAANILTGFRSELLPQFASHIDINSLLLCGPTADDRALAQKEAAESVKRVRALPPGAPAPSPYLILDFQEIKTTWHPVGV